MEKNDPVARNAWDRGREAVPPGGNGAAVPHLTSRQCHGGMSFVHEPL